MEDEMANTVVIQIDKIDLTGSTQSRRRTHDELTVERYREVLEEDPDAKFPAIVLFKEGEGRAEKSKYWVGDGHQRIEAHKRAGRKTITATIHAGGQMDALIYSLGANEEHGLRPTIEDRRHKVEVVLTDPVLSKKYQSKKAIADLCKVSQNLVKSVMEELIERGEAEKKEKVAYTRNGKTCEMDTSKIGKGGATSQLRSSEPEDDDEEGPERRVMDDVGQVVPEHLIPVFEEREPMRKALSHLREVAEILNGVKARNSSIDIKQAATLGRLNAYNGISWAIPFAVCPDCHGNQKGCRLCGERGFVVGEVWERNQKTVQAAGE